MTGQKRDTDFAHVRVGTTIGFELPDDENITTDKPYLVKTTDTDGVPWFEDDAARLRHLNKTSRWLAWHGYIISQPGEAPQTTSERTDTDRLNWLSRRHVTVTDLRRYGFGDTFEVGPDNDLDIFELDAWDGLREAIDAAMGREDGEQVITPQAPATSEAAIRDKALEDAARVCDEESSALIANFHKYPERNQRVIEDKARMARVCAAAIRQMKGSGV